MDFFLQLSVQSDQHKIFKRVHFGKNLILPKTHKEKFLFMAEMILADLRNQILLQVFVNIFPLKLGKKKSNLSTLNALSC